MARKPVFDTCMLCGEYPCECKKKAPKKAAKKPVKATTVAVEAPEPAPAPIPLPPPPVDTPPAPRPDPRAAMRAMAGRSRIVQPQPEPTPAPAQANLIINYTPQTTGDSVIDDAIRAAAPLLAADERSKYSDILWTYTPEMGRAAAWRKRYEEVRRGVQ